jgi:small GTP-binding protein
MSDLPVQFKYIVIGASGVGKTSIVRRLTENKFVKATQTTVGIEYFTHVSHIDGRAVKMMIWDTAGQERFYTIAKAYFRSALGVVLVYDITDRKSFDSLPRWLRDARTEADPHCTVILVGNKSDMAGSRIVSTEEAMAFAKEHDLTYLETSALDGTQIESVFQRTAQDLLRKAAVGEIAAATGPPQGAVRLAREEKTDKKCNC